MTPNSRGVRTGSAGGLFLYICVVHGLGRVVGSIATSFDEDMSLQKLVIVQRERERDKVPSRRLFGRNSCRNWDMGRV